jgi:hypothetical protein
MERFCLSAEAEGFGRVRVGWRDWVFVGFSGSGASGGFSETWAFRVRTLFDNFIGRKRDVGGGVLAGLFR